MVSEPRWTRLLSSSDLHPDHFFPVLHQKQRIYHLISQVNKLLIKLAWSTMLGVKEIPKVQTVDLTLYVWLCDRLSASLTTFATSSPFFSLYSLQQLSSSYCIRNGSSNRAYHSLQLSPVDERHGGTSPHQEALHTHRSNRGSANFKSWQRKVMEQGWWSSWILILLSISI